jgi:hypothetical protein
MKIFFEDPEVFDGLDTRRELQRVFFRAGIGQHTIIVPDQDRFLQSVFFRSVAEMDRAEWEELVQRTGYDEMDRTEEPGARPISFHASVGRARGARSATCKFALTAAEVGDWAEQPLRLLMENERDWVLIEAAARAFGRATIEDAYLKHWIVVDGRGGGGEVLNSLRGRGRHERLFAFVDQDPHPITRERSKTSRLIEGECMRDPCVPHHVTWKHEIENYVPQSILSPRVFSGNKASLAPREDPAQGVAARALCAVAHAQRVREGSGRHEGALRGKLHGEGAQGSSRRHQMDSCRLSGPRW